MILYRTCEIFFLDRALVCPLKLLPLPDLKSVRGIAGGGDETDAVNN